MKKNKLLIPIFMGMSYRNFISSNVLNNLFIEHEIYFLTYKNSKVSELLQSLDLNVIEFELKFFNKVIRKLTSFIEKIQYYNFYQKHQTDTTQKYIKRDMKSFWNRVLFKISNLIGKIYNEFSFFSRHYEFFLDNSTKKKIKIFDKVFLLSTDDVMDKAILKFCKKKGIKVNIIVHSWDNLPARGFLADKPNRLLVWNSVMKKQAQVLHGIDEHIIDIVGIPQFYFYKQIENKISYDDFIQYYGLEYNKKVITYTCSAFRVFPDEDLFIKKLVKYTEKYNFNFILRLHPTERIDEYTKLFSNIKHVILDIPSGSFAATITKNINIDEIEILKFISLMKYSNVVLNLASTITLDAIIFDTSVVCISFNMDETIKEHWNSAEKWYESSHYIDIINSNAVKIAKNFDELEKCISLYISDEKIDSQNRKELAKFFCNIDYDVPNLLLESMKK